MITKQTQNLIREILDTKKNMHRGKKGVSILALLCMTGFISGLSFVPFTVAPILIGLVLKDNWATFRLTSMELF